MSEQSALELFSEFNNIFNQEHALREDLRLVIRDIEQTCREISTILQTVHQNDGITNVDSVCQKTDSLFLSLQSQFSSLSLKLGHEHYYRFHEMWRFAVQKAAFLAAFVIYLRFNRLATREDISRMIGVKLSKEDGFHLDLEDYLMALLQLATELSRLAVNVVTAGDYRRPFHIASFVAELDAGFRLLNLKNDQLRKRFDSLKYSLKKIEEVVYDVTIRQLKPTDETGTDSDGTKNRANDESQRIEST